ncbi:MAG: DHA2 family efflux MFS transporter permease subunit [Alicyclobacillus sp.]|nr:DHA2 family efflux MFS transporter permease subunit [Alicyclobacillus sp.]
MKDVHTSERAVSTKAVFGVLLVGAFIAFLNQTLINVALPQIMDRLHIAAATADWLTTIYLLVNGIVIPVTAFLLERFTTRQLYLTSLGLFTVGSIICALAPNFAVILVGRVVQAAGAGVLFPLITNVIFVLFPPHRRGFAMGVFGIAINFAPAIGPTLSGWLLEGHSWRVLFFIVFPIALADWLVACFLVRNVTETQAQRLDTFGVILSTIGFGGVLYGFAEAGTRGWSDPAVAGTLVVGMLSLVLFLWRQLVISHPILEFRIFRYPMFSLTTVVNVVVTMAMYSGMILMPIYIQNVRGFSPLLSGLMLLPGGIVMGIMSPVTGRLFDRFGARWLAVLGLAITIATTYALTRLQLNTSFTYVTVVYTVRMFGMSIMMMPIFTAGLNELPLALNRYGTAMVNTLRMVAGAIGTALFVTIMTNRGAMHAKQIMQTAGISPKDTAHVLAAAHQGAVMGINDAFMVATLMTVVSFVLAFFIRRTEPKEDIIHQRARVAAQASAGPKVAGVGQRISQGD